MKTKTAIIAAVVAIGLLAETAGMSAQRRRRDPPGVKTFEIHLSESTSQQLPYTRISNVARGEVAGTPPVP